jgi:hypothetical protein
VNNDSDSNGNEEQEVIVWTKQAAGDYEHLPVLEPGEYAATFSGIKTVAKPENKLTGKEGEDLQQWEWKFDLTDEELEGYTFRKWTSRSLHEKSNAYGILQGMGRALPQDGVPYGISQQIGCPCRIVLKTYTKTKQDGTEEERNYIDSWLPPRKARTAQAASEGLPKPVGKAQISDIIQLAHRAGMPVTSICNDLGISDLTVLSEKKAAKVIARLQEILADAERPITPPDDGDEWATLQEPNEAAQQPTEAR